MGTLKIKEIRKLSKLEREKQLNDLHEELLLLRSKTGMGGTLDNPSRIKIIKRSIARIKTIIKEDELGINLSLK